MFVAVNQRDVDISVCSWSTATKANHQADSNVGEAAYHVGSDVCCRGRAIGPIGQAGDTTLWSDILPSVYVLVSLGDG